MTFQLDTSPNPSLQVGWGQISDSSGVSVMPCQLHLVINIAINIRTKECVVIRFFSVQKLRYTVTAVIQLLTFHFVVLCESIIFVVKFNSSILQFFLHRVFGYRGIILFPWVARMYDRDVNGRESKSDTSFCNSQAYCLAYRTRQFSRKFGVGLFPCAPPQTSCTVREWTSSIETSSNSLT